MSDLDDMRWGLVKSDLQRHAIHPGTNYYTPGETTSLCGRVLNEISRKSTELGMNCTPPRAVSAPQSALQRWPTSSVQQPDELVN